jgi:hypothetical protein
MSRNTNAEERTVGCILEHLRSETAPDTQKAQHDFCDDLVLRTPITHSGLLRCPGA